MQPPVPLPREPFLAHVRQELALQRSTLELMQAFGQAPTVGAVPAEVLVFLHDRIRSLETLERRLVASIRAEQLTRELAGRGPSTLRERLRSVLSRLRVRHAQR